MPFQAPNLTTQIDPVNYQNEIDSNFSAIEAALQAIQSELDVAQPGQSGGASKIGALDSFLDPDGVIGTDSFQLSFDTDEEGLSITHSPNTSKSAAIINQRYFETTDAFSIDLRTLVSIDGTYRIAVGLRDSGSPNVEMKVVQSDGLTGDADELINLLLWDFDFTKTGSVYSISNLRRRATILLSRESFEEAHGADVPLTCSIASLPSTTGFVTQGVVVPWDCEVTGAFLQLGINPTDSAVTDPTVEIEIRRPSPSDQVVQGSGFWSDTDAAGLVREFAALPEPIQLTAGTPIQPFLVQADSDGTAGNLNMTILVKRLYHPIF